MIGTTENSKTWQPGSETGAPLVSIGLPVYNGEQFLAVAIESVLNQTYAAIELIISDNGSTDATEEISRRFAAQDNRVRYYRSPQNQGASWNYNRTVELARGKYFRWLAHDDKLAPELLEKSVAVLDNRPDVVSCITWFADIDDSGNVLEIRQSTVSFDAPLPNTRFLSMSKLHPAYNCEEVFGLMRIDVLRRTKLIANYVDSDRTLIAELGLHGPFFEIPEPLFLHRIHKSSSVVVSPSRYQRTIWFDPSKEGKLVFPHWRQYGELWGSIQRSPLPLDERIRCYGHMLRWAKRSRRRLEADIVRYFEK